MTKISISRLEKLLNKPKRTLPHQSGYCQEIFDDYLLEKVFEGVDIKIFLEGLTDEEDIKLDYFMTALDAYSRVIEELKLDLQKNVRDEAAAHCRTLQAIFKEELRNKSPDLTIGKSIERRTKETLSIVEAKLEKIDKEEQKLLSEVVNYLREDLDTMVKMVTKRLEVEEKEAKAVASVYSYVVNYFSFILFVLILCMIVIFAFAYGSVILW